MKNKLILLKVILSMTLLCIVSDAESDELLFKLDKESYTTQELTLVAREKVDKVLQKASNLQQNENRYNVGHCRLVGSWEGPARPAPAVFYEKLLGAAVDTFIAAKVFERFKNKHNTDASRYYDSAKLLHAIRGYARGKSKYFHKVAIKTLRDNGSATEYWEKLQETFPKNFKDKPKTVKAYFKNKFKNDLKPCHPYALIEAECFPYFKDGTVALWYRKHEKAVGFKYHIESFLDENPGLRRKYHEATLMNRTSKLYYLVIQDLNRSHVEEIEGMMSTMLDNIKTDKPETIFRSAEQTLSKTQSSVAFAKDRGRLDEVQKKWDLSRYEIIPRTLIPVKNKSSNEEKKDYVFILHWEPTTDLIRQQRERSDPSEYDFRIAIEQLVLPLVKEVKGDLKLYKDVQISEDRDIAREAFGGPVPTEAFGMQFQEYINEEVE